MLVRAKVSFAGTFSMYKGEVKECSNETTLQDLLQAGYIEEVKQETQKGGSQDESKRNNRRKSG